MDEDGPKLPVIVAIGVILMVCVAFFYFWHNRLYLDIVTGVIW